MSFPNACALSGQVSRKTIIDTVNEYKSAVMDQRKKPCKECAMGNTKSITK